VPLDEGSRWRADADDQVEGLFGKESMQVIDERPFRVFVAGTNAHQRMFGDVQSPR